MGIAPPAVEIYGTPYDEEDNFMAVPNDTLYVPEVSVNTYQNSIWGQLFGIILPITTNATEEYTLHTTALQVHPNPTSGVVNIEGANSEEVSVFSANGALVKRVQGNRIDLSNQPAGVYVLKTGNKTARIIKQ